MPTTKNLNVLDIPGGAAASVIKPPTKPFLEAKAVAARYNPQAKKDLHHLSPNQVQNAPPTGGSKVGCDNMYTGKRKIPVYTGTRNGAVSLLEKLAGDSGYDTQNAKESFVSGAISGIAKRVIPKAIHPLAKSLRDGYVNNASVIQGLAGMGVGAGADTIVDAATGQDISNGWGAMVGGTVGLLSPRLGRLARGRLVPQASRDWVKRKWVGDPTSAAWNIPERVGLKATLGTAGTVGFVGDLQEAFTPEGINVSKPIQTARRLADRQAQLVGANDRHELEYVIQQLRNNPEARRAFIQSMQRRAGGWFG